MAKLKGIEEYERTQLWLRTGPGDGPEAWLICEHKRCEKCREANEGALCPACEHNRNVIGTLLKENGRLSKTIGEYLPIIEHLAQIQDALGKLRVK